MNQEKDVKSGRGDSPDWCDEDSERDESADKVKINCLIFKL